MRCDNPYNITIALSDGEAFILFIKQTLEDGIAILNGNALSHASHIGDARRIPLVLFTCMSHANIQFS